MSCSVAHSKPFFADPAPDTPRKLCHHSSDFSMAVRQVNHLSIFICLALIAVCQDMVGQEVAAQQVRSQRIAASPPRDATTNQMWLLPPVEDNSSAIASMGCIIGPPVSVFGTRGSLADGCCRRRLCCPQCVSGISIRYRWISSSVERVPLSPSRERGISRIDRPSSLYQWPYPTRYRRSPSRVLFDIVRCRKHREHVADACR